MSDRVRLICIVLTILCIFAVLAGRCIAAGEVERIAARTKAQVRAMIITEERARISYADTYIPGAYSGQSQEQTVINQNINRNTVIVETPEPIYYFPVYNYQHDRQHWDAVNRSLLNR